MNTLTPFLTVVMWGVKLGIIVRQLNAGNDQVVLLIGGVGAEDQPVDTVVFPLGPAGHTTQQTHCRCNKVLNS